MPPPVGQPVGNFAAYSCPLGVVGDYERLGNRQVIGLARTVGSMTDAPRVSDTIQGSIQVH